MRYLKWAIIVLATITGLAAYSVISEGHSLQFALLEAHPLPAAMTLILGLVYAGVAGVKKLTGK